jgi:hypothetical protein
MADCHKVFLDFDKKIFLAKLKRDSLLKAVNDLRDKIKKDFKSDGGEYLPRFALQGSFEMDTIINPIEKGDYDIDDGVYFDVDTIPEETPITFHRWIYESIKGYTDNIIDKNPCVRVIFSDGHNVDLTIYYQIKYENHPKLAHKADGWIESDPQEFIKWFEDNMDSDQQLKRIVRYIKAWAYNKAGTMPSGLILTILATQNIVFDNRDDIAFLKTVKKIKNWLDIAFVCFRPTTPSYEDLLKNYSTTNREYFKNSINSLIESGEQAVQGISFKDAYFNWKKHFGDRFSGTSVDVGLQAEEMAIKMREGKLGIDSKIIIGSNISNKIKDVKPTKFYGKDSK